MALPDGKYVHLFVPTGSVELEGSGVLQEGDAARVVAAGARRVTALANSEVLAWEMDRSLDER